MKKLLFIFLGCAFLSTGSMTAYGGEKAPDKVRDLAETVLAKLGTDSVIVKAVKAENSKKKSLDEIKKTDQKWSNTIGVDDFMDSMLNSECSKHLVTIKKRNIYFEEIFVTDNQGANVAMTDKTSDYWQGDEAKFIKSFKEGVGAVYISDVNFDDSTQSYLTQVSVPVMDGETAIGVITFGINVDKVN